MRWRATLGAAAPDSVAVNLSRAQLCQSDLTEMVQHELLRSGMQPQWLRLEVTESLAMQDNGALALLQHLKGLGVGLALDDFGTGYSSLACLRLPAIDTLKIDTSFVGKMTDDDEASEIVRAIITLAHNLRKDMIAEGVETASQLARLREMRCTYAQGYDFSRPVPAEAAGKLIAADPRW